MNRSPLLPSHESAGARLGEGRPGAVPGSEPAPFVLTFGDVPAEYEAATGGCALWDTTERGLLRASGADAAQFLHGLLANDVRSLAPGAGNENLLLTAKGKVRQAFLLFAREGDFTASTEPGRGEELRAALDMYHFTEDVTLADESETHAPLTLAGPEAHAVLARLVPELPALAPVAWTELTWSGGPLFVAATRVAGGEGFLVDAGPERAVELWEALREAGATPCGQVVFDILRCERRAAAFGVDVTEDVYPQEARLEHAFSLDKGCYIGQEVVAKIDTYGGLNKELTVLRVSHDDPVPAGTPLVVHEDGEARNLGIVTSWAYSFVLDTGIVLAYVKRKHQEPGTTFDLAGAEATIVDAPLAATAS